jgi:hypothetical protein
MNGIWKHASNMLCINQELDATHCAQQLDESLILSAKLKVAQHTRVFPVHCCTTFNKWRLVPPDLDKSESVISLVSGKILPKEKKKKPCSSNP